MEKSISWTKKIGSGVSTILLGETKELLARIDERTSMMKEDIKEIKPKVNEMSPKVDILWKDKLAPASSPRKLNSRGQDILEQSGIKEIIEAKKEILFNVIKTKDVSNPYDAEQTILLVVDGLLEYCPDTITKLKEGAFKTGAGIDGVLFVGGLHLRDLVFPELGFSLDDLDKPKNG